MDSCFKSLKEKKMGSLVSSLLRLGFQWKLKEVCLKKFHQKMMEMMLDIGLGSKMSYNKKLHDKADTMAEKSFCKWWKLVDYIFFYI